MLTYIFGDNSHELCAMCPIFGTMWTDISDNINLYFWQCWPISHTVLTYILDNIDLHFKQCDLYFSQCWLYFRQCRAIFQLFLTYINSAILDLYSANLDYICYNVDLYFRHDSWALWWRSVYHDNIQTGTAGTRRQVLRGQIPQQGY